MAPRDRRYFYGLSEPGKEGCKDEQDPVNPLILPFLFQDKLPF